MSGLRAIPNLNVFRPADINETLECWEASLNNEKGPSAIILSRQKLNYISKFPDKKINVFQVLTKLILLLTIIKLQLIASGSEVELGSCNTRTFKRIGY